MMKINLIKLKNLNILKITKNYSKTTKNCSLFHKKILKIVKATTITQKTQKNFLNTLYFNFVLKFTVC